MAKLRHGSTSYQGGAADQERQPRLGYTVKFDGIPFKIRTSLTSGDIAQLHPLSFHGTSLGEMKYFETGNGYFRGWFSSVEFKDAGAVGTGEFLPLFFLSGFQTIKGICIGGMGISLDAAVGAMLGSFAKTGYTSLEREGFSAIILIGQPKIDTELTYLTKKDVLSIITLSEPEAASIVRKATKYPEGSTYWKLNRGGVLMRLAKIKLAQKIIDELERLAFEERASRAGESSP